MVKVVSKRSMTVTKANKGMYYEFKAGQPVEVAEEHLEFLPGLGKKDSEFQKVGERPTEPKSEPEPAVKEESRTPKKKKTEEVD